MAHPAALKWGRYFSLIRVGLGSVPVSVVSSREGENILSDAHLMSICHVPFSVYHFWTSQVQCEFLPCWATEWALGSVNSTRWKGLGPGILYSLSRYSFNNPRKFFPPYCPSKISQCCLERNIGRVRKQFLFHSLDLAGHHWDLGAVIDVEWETDLSKRVLCEEKTIAAKQRLPFAKWVCWLPVSWTLMDSVLFGVLGDRTWDQLSSALCLSISDGGWVTGCLPSSLQSVCSPWN